MASGPEAYAELVCCSHFSFQRGASHPFELVRPLVLEVDVDVRRLRPFLRDEPLEQHRHPRRIHFGDAQGIAHRGIGGRAAALAQDALRSRVGDQVGHREEVVLVAHLADQHQLALDLLHHRLRRARRPAAPHALLRQDA